MCAMIESIEDVDFLSVCHCRREHWSIVSLSILCTMLRSLLQLASLLLSYHITRMHSDQLITSFINFLNLISSEDYGNVFNFI